jgi:hypothetical protein
VGSPRATIPAPFLTKGIEKMKQKTTKKPDVEKAKSDLKKAIKERDPFLKWLPVLNEMKAELEDAKSKKISVSQIRKILVDSGIQVPHDVLKKFLGIDK